jgi:hypothetical protein
MIVQPSQQYNKPHILYCHNNNNNNNNNNNGVGPGNLKKRDAWQM